MEGQVLMLDVFVTKTFLTVITATSGMLNKLLKVPAFSRGKPSKQRHPETPPKTPKNFTSALRIVHAGGKVEFYYMAIPAVRILEKYPSFVLAKPEVFQRPWNSVVRPEKILTPGRKFLLVPLETVKKLQRKVRKPSKDPIVSFVSQASNDVSSEASGSFISAFRKRSGIKKHVTFAGIEAKHKAKASGSSRSVKKDKTKKDSKKNPNSQSHRRPGNALVWQPSLNSIDESQEN